jgi:hypothetical protein
MHEPDSAIADDIRDLMRVGDDRCHTARQHRALELLWDAQAAFDMHVRIDQPRRDVRTAKVDLTVSGISPTDARDQFTGDRDIGFFDL